MASRQLHPEREFARYLASFQDCKLLLRSSPDVLARCGIYCEYGTTLRCSHCGQIIDIRKVNEAELEHHKLQHASCPLFSDECLIKVMGKDRILISKARAILDVTGRMNADTSGPEQRYSTPAKHILRTCFDRATYRRVFNSSLPGVNAVANRLNPDYNILLIELNRVSTFYDWPMSTSRNVSPENLAKAGFFYTGFNDQIKCASCRHLFEYSTCGDSLAKEHRRYSPACEFVASVFSSHVDQANEVGETQVQTVQGLQSAGLNLTNDDVNITLEVPGPSVSNNEPYTDIAARLASFKDNTIPQGQNAKTLAEAGFYLEDLMNCHAQSSSSSTSKVSGLTAVRQDEADVQGAIAIDPAAKELEEYLEENRKLYEARMCKKCLDEVINVVFLPCGHLVCCNACAVAVKNCPFCDKPIRENVRINTT